MADAWTADDLGLAGVGAARLEPPPQVAGDLLSAADQPGTCLAGVTPLQARLRAAEVLIEAGLCDDAIAVVRRAVHEEGPDPDGLARMTAAPLLPHSRPADAAAALAAGGVTHPAAADY